MAQSFNNLSLCYYRKGQYEKVIDFNLKALKIQEIVLGYDHIDVILILFVFIYEVALTLAVLQIM